MLSSQYRLIKVGSPPLKALTCLESNDATVGDVYIFWHATIWAIKEELTRPRCEIPSRVQEQIVGILNARHDQLFTKGKLASASELYLPGAYLNPVYLTSDLFNRDRAPENQAIEYSGISHFSTFKRVMRFLVQSAESEVMKGHEEALTKWKGRATEFRNQLLNELKMYARQQFPFNTRVDGNKAIIAWWQASQGHELAQILPILAIKIFSVRVNSMAEERTVSAFTWITPALRSRLSLLEAQATNVLTSFVLEARKHSTPRPTVKFYDVKSKILRTSGVTPESERLQTGKGTQSGRQDASENSINLRSKYLSNFLASEKEAEKKKDGEGKAAQSATPSKQGEGDGEDNDFSMDFDSD
ncbi:hypothetical protein CVT26_001386 [Gymnopilus dilepis]|uniref:Uncharacterized protein n=1 Tax=Gymnopilus dilepis TaxID=231916 RepID=A0A409WVT6_9AGAR|nr:hypothetical protein CVT26_001386 [Gymnopilus dilepis]